MNKKVALWMFLLIIIFTVVGCSIYYGISFDAHEPLPNSGKWKNKDYGIVVDFDQNTVSIREGDKEYVGKLTVFEESLLDACIPLEGTYNGHTSYRGLKGYCIEANEHGFRIRSTLNNESWWFYRINATKQ